MNPETLYPDLLTLKPGEIFIEWVRISQNLVIIQKIHYKKIILEKEKSKLHRELKERYGNCEIEMITISKVVKEVEEKLITLY